MLWNLKRLGTYAYERVSPNIRSSLGARALLRTLLPFFSLKVEIVRLWGKEYSTAEKLVTLCVGEEPWISYMKRLIYLGEYQEEKLKSGSIRRVIREIPNLDPQADLIVVRVDDVLGNLFSPQDYLTIPEWIAFEVALPGPFGEGSKISRSAKTDLRRIRGNKLSFEVSHDDQVLERFYYEMHIPYISKRHEELARIFSLSGLRRYFRKGGLLLVKKSGEFISGLLYWVPRHTFHAVALGIKDGRLDFLEQGAGAALYYFSMMWARQHGYTSMYFGGSRSFLNDGAFRYKRKWNMRVIHKPDNYYCFKLRIFNFSQPVRQFLYDNPFIFRNGRALNGLIFLNQNHPVTAIEIRRSYKRHYTDGLSKLYIISWSGFTHEARPRAGVPLSQVELVDMRKVPFDRWLRCITGSGS